MDFHGIIVYEIIENGHSLKGVYTNTQLNNEHQIMNEVVKKTSPEDGIIGVYSCRFIEKDKKAYMGELEIKKINEVYECLWKVEDDNRTLVDTFKGIGLKTGNNYLSVSYWYL